MRSVSRRPLDRRLRRVNPAVVAVCAAALLAACARPEESTPFACPEPATTIDLSDIHYPEETCESARQLAEGHLTSGIYRTSCRQLAPASGLPPSAVAASASQCEPASERDGYDGGVVVQIQVCCPSPD